MNKSLKEVFTNIEDEKLDKPLFRRIGTGFVNRDESLNVILDALPVSGRLHIRPATPNPKTQEQK
ncbi:MAG: hypothetical protein QGI45_14300 [Myxococcota bacterium]|nr:hypothetical protein [Myxococcota bacterium]